MDYIPSYMLKQIYVPGSMKNVDGGFQFALKNNIAPGTLTGLPKLEVDGKAVEIANVMVGKGEANTKAGEVSYQKPVYFDMSSVFVVKVLGMTLEPGQHTVVLTVNTSEIGRINVPITDTIQ